MSICVEISDDSYCDECGCILDYEQAIALCYTCASKKSVGESIISTCQPINLGFSGQQQTTEYLCQYDHSSYLWVHNDPPNYCPNCGRKVQK